MTRTAFALIIQMVQSLIASKFPLCTICGDDLRDTFEIHEDDCSNPVCDECFRYRLPRQRIENPPDRFRPQANFYTRRPDAGNEESLEKEVFINE